MDHGAIQAAAQVIDVLRANEAELRASGIRHLSLFGSVARGEATPASDIDLAAVLEPAADMDLFRLTALERHLATLFHRKVDLVPEPVEKPRLQANIDRDRMHAF